MLDAEVEVPDQIHFLIYQGPYLNRTAQRADVLLPSPAFLEQEGTFTNAERRVQKLHPAFPQDEQMPSATEVLAMMMRALGYSQAAQSAVEVLDEIDTAVPFYGGITSERLERDWSPVALSRYHPPRYPNSVSRQIQPWSWLVPACGVRSGGQPLKITFLEPLGFSATELRKRANRLWLVRLRSPVSLNAPPICPH